MENKKPMSMGTKIAISYAVCFGLSIVLFVCFTMLRIFLNMFYYGSVFRSIITVLQYIIPIILILFGWLPPLLFKKKEDKIN